jgi:hypothetical protein
MAHPRGCGGVRKKSNVFTREPQLLLLLVSDILRLDSLDFIRRDSTMITPMMMLSCLFVRFSPLVPIIQLNPHNTLVKALVVVVLPYRGS